MELAEYRFQRLTFRFCY